VRDTRGTGEAAAAASVCLRPPVRTPYHRLPPPSSLHRLTPCCSSPLVRVSLPPGSFSLPAAPAAPLVFGLVFQDNDRNVQLNLPLNLTVYWSS